MVSAILSAAFIWLVFYGRLALGLHILLCAVVGVTLAVAGRHRHTRFVMIDVFAQSSRLKPVNPALKLWTTLVLILISITARSPAACLFLCLLSPTLVVCIGGLRLSEYIRLLSLPLSFLMLSGFALLFEITAQQTGVLGFRIFGTWFCMSETTQVRTTLVITRALGAISSLYMLSLTTPMTEIIGVLRRVRCPEVISDLMYLIYRYIFVLLSMFYIMRDAAKSRLGFVDYRTSLRTTAMLYSGLFLNSFRQAGRNFDAMESRCYGSGIRFLERKEKVTVLQAVCVTAILIVTVSFTVITG